MDDYTNKVKGTELEEEERNNEQDSCRVAWGYLSWVGTHVVCCALEVTVGPFLVTYSFSHLHQLKFMFEEGNFTTEFRDLYLQH